MLGPKQKLSGRGTFQTFLREENRNFERNFPDKRKRL